MIPSKISPFSGTCTSHRERRIWWARACGGSIPRLLVWEPAQGWEPLCEFLGVPEPDGPVPRVNDTAAFHEGMVGRALAVLNEWWDQRERSANGLHGAPVAR